jgi:Na+-transporting methylmalonyl-CoA/oxaloacetate decarboxylase gamma subunit
VKSGFWDILSHGFVMFVVLLITEGVSVLVPQHFVPGILTTVVTFLLACFIDGYAGKWVASFWEEEEYVPEEEREAEAAKAEWRQEKLQPKF